MSDLTLLRRIYDSQPEMDDHLFDEVRAHLIAAWDEAGHETVRSPTVRLRRARVVIVAAAAATVLLIVGTAFGFGVTSRSCAISSCARCYAAPSCTAARRTSSASASSRSRATTST